MVPKKVTPGRIVAECRFIVYLVAAALFLFAGGARANLQFDVFVGYDQLLPEHGWFPITCELYNDGPSFNAVIEVTSGQWGGAQIRRLPIDLPTNTRKRVVIPVFSSGENWSARLVDLHGNVIADQSSQNARLLPNHLPLVAALARTVGGMPTFPESDSGAWSTRYTAARLQSALFPDNPLALEGIDLLYISSEKAAELTIGQVTALEAWLQNGGHLVVGLEQISDLSGTPWLRDWLPCDLTTTVNLPNHDSLQEWVRSRPNNVVPTPKPRRRRAQNTNAPAFRMRQHAGPPPGSPRAAPVSGFDGTVNAQQIVEDPDFDAAPLQVATGSARGEGKILIGDSDAPLAFEGYNGRGRITVLGFSPEREPFLSWKNRGWFWARLAEVPPGALQAPQSPQVMAQMSSDAIFRAMIDSRQIRKLPLGWLLALLAAYLVVIGPLDQYWLKKINRQMLTWVTFPGYVLAFSGLIYFIGFHLRAGELEWNELSLVDVLPGKDRAVLRGQTYVSIYSPVNAHYELASDQPFATLRGEYLGNFGASIDSSRLSVVQRGNNFDADVAVPVWTSQLFVSDWLQAAPLPMTMNAIRLAAGWQVTVENKMDRTLAGARVVLDGRIFTVGDLAAGQSKTVTFAREAGTLVREWTQDNSRNFFQAAQATRNSFGNNGMGINDLATGSMAVSFLSQINQDNGNGWQTFTGPDDLDLSRYAAPGYGILLAWDPDHNLVPGLNRFTVKRAHRNTLLRLVVPLPFTS